MQQASHGFVMHELWKYLAHVVFSGAVCAIACALCSWRVVCYLLFITNITFMLNRTWQYRPVVLTFKGRLWVSSILLGVQWCFLASTLLKVTYQLRFVDQSWLYTSYVQPGPHVAQSKVLCDPV